MPTCKQRILKLMMNGKQLSIDEMTKALKHGRSTVKSAVLILKRDGFIKIVAQKRSYNSTTPSHVWGWTGKKDLDPKAPSPTIANRNKLIMAALERMAPVSVYDLAVETRYSQDLIRTALRALRDEGKARIADWRPQHGAPIALYGLSDGSPDAIFVKHRLKVARRAVEAPVEPQRPVVIPRRDPAASWF